MQHYDHKDPAQYYPVNLLIKCGRTDLIICDAFFGLFLLADFSLLDQRGWRDVSRTQFAAHHFSNSVFAGSRWSQNDNLWDLKEKYTQFNLIVKIKY